MPYKSPKESKQWKARAYIKNKLWLEAYKVAKGCEICGETDLRCLECHHIEPGRNVHMCLSSSLARLKRELENCIILCANCHCKSHK